MSTNQLPGRDGSWVKASRSSNSGQCVEMRRQGAVVEVRDSKDPTGPCCGSPVRSSPRGWTAPTAASSPP